MIGDIFPVDGPAAFLWEVLQFWLMQIKSSVDAWFDVSQLTSYLY